MIMNVSHIYLMNPTTWIVNNNNNINNKNDNTRLLFFFHDIQSDDHNTGFNAQSWRQKS